jgi:hypothetical protein
MSEDEDDIEEEIPEDRDEPDESSAESYQWWRFTDEEDIKTALLDNATRLFDQQSERREQYLHRTKLFENLQLSSPDASGYLDGYTALDEGDDRRLLRSAVCTARAEIYSPQQPKGQILTNGATWDMKRVARRLDKIHEGLLSLPTEDGFANVWAAGVDGFGMGALCHGLGAFEISACFRRKKVIQRCVRECDIYFDPAEGKNPRTIYVIEPFELTAAQDEHPDHAEELVDEKPFEDFPVALSAISKVLRRVRAWRLGANGKPGKFVEAVGNVLVETRDFKRPMFPFVFLRWERHRESPYGMGLIQEGEYLAWTATDIFERLARRQRIASGKRVFYKAGAVNKDALQANDEEVHVETTGDPSTSVHETVTPAFSAAEPNFAELMLRGYWDGIGISQVSAAARREAGMETGVALRTLNNTKRGRQLDKAQAYELAFVDVCRQHTWCVQELGEAFPDLELKFPGARGVKTAKIAEALLGKDVEFAATLGPASAFTNSTAGRRALIAELFSQQVITPAAYEAMLQWPDLESDSNLVTIENDYVDNLIEKLLDAKQGDWDEGSYVSPEPFLQDPNGALLRVTAAYFKAHIDEAPEFNMQLLYRLLKDFGGIMNKVAAAASGTAESIKYASPVERGMINTAAAGAPMPPAAPPVAPPVA